MVMQATVEPLPARASRWKRALADAAVGPLVIAAEVTALGENWEAYRDEANGVSCSSWLKAIFGRGHGLSWFNARAEAVARLGEACRRTMHHEVAVWVTNQVVDEHIEQVKLALMRGCRKNGGNPLTLAQARPVIYEIAVETAAE